MTLKVNKDSGATWHKILTLYKGPSAYSDITRLPDGDIGFLFEAGVQTPYEGIVWNRISKSEFNSN